MTNQELIEIIGNLEDKDMLYNPCDDQEAKTMAIKVINTWDKLFKSYETLTAEITESGDIKNATKHIDDWRVGQLRGIISDYYAELTIEEARE